MLLRKLALILTVSGPALLIEEPSFAGLTADDLIPILKANESAISTYQGRLQHTKYSVTITNQQGVVLRPLNPPKVTSTTDLTFKHDLTRGGDYWMQMRASFSLNPIRTPLSVEHRNGGSVETLLSTAAREPKSAMIGPPNDTSYLGHQPENFYSRVSLHRIPSPGSSESSEGVPFSDLLQHGDGSWIEVEPVELDGQRCIKFAVVSSYERYNRLSIVYLGQDIGLAAVKVQEVLLGKDDPLNKLITSPEESAKIRNLVAQRESLPPDLLVANREYTRMPTGVWLPHVTNAYSIGPLQGELDQGVGKADIQAAFDRDPILHNFRNCMLLGYSKFELNADSIVLNEPLAPQIFETSIIPPGVPVSNFLLNIHPREVNSAIRRSIETVGSLPPVVQSNTNELLSTHPMQHPISVAIAERPPKFWGPLVCVMVFISASAIVIVYLVRRHRREN